MRHLLRLCGNNNVKITYRLFCVIGKLKSIIPVGMQGYFLVLFMWIALTILTNEP